MSEEAPPYGDPATPRGAGPCAGGDGDVVGQIRRRVRELRRAQALSEIDLAVRADLSALRVIAIEDGVGLVKPGEILSLARALGVPVAKLLEDG